MVAPRLWLAFQAKAMVQICYFLIALLEPVVGVGLHDVPFKVVEHYMLIE